MSVESWILEWVFGSEFEIQKVGIYTWKSGPKLDLGSNFGFGTPKFDLRILNLEYEFQSQIGL